MKNREIGGFSRTRITFVPCGSDIYFYNNVGCIAEVTKADVIVIKVMVV